MSEQLFRYSRSNAEVRGTISRLLSASQLRVLATARDLQSLHALLLETPYRVSLPPSFGGGAGLAATERAVLRSLVDAYRRVASLHAGAAAALIREMARHLELDNLKAILRAKVRGEPPQQVRPLLIPLGRLSSLPVEELLEVRDVDAVASLLAGSDYDAPLRHSLPRFSAEGSLFPVEVALDLDYYRRLWRAVAALSGPDRSRVERMMGIRYDLLNVDWVVRYRLTYHLLPEEILNLTLPYGRKVDAATVRRASTADSLDGIAAALPEPYRSLLGGAGAEGAVAADLACQRYLVSVARAVLAGYPFHLGVSVAYLWLKEAEAHDLKVVLEGKRYHQSADAILRLVWGLP